MRSSDETISKRVRELLKDKNLSQRWLAEEIDMQVSYLNELLNLTRNRRWNSDHIDSVAKALKVEAWQLLRNEAVHSNLMKDGADIKYEAATNENKLKRIPSKISFEHHISPVRVMGEVQAGVWHESTAWPEEDQYTLAVPAIDSWAKSCYGVAVKGDSMNLRYPEGTVLIVIPLMEYPLALKSGDNVIVHRQRAGIVESTVKELVVKGKTAQLLPRSDNPRFREPVNIHWPHACAETTDVESVEIVAVVVGSYKMEKRL